MTECATVGGIEAWSSYCRGATVSTSTNEITMTVHYPLFCYKGTLRNSEATTSLEAYGGSKCATDGYRPTSGERTLDTKLITLKLPGIPPFLAPTLLNLR